MAVAHPGLKIIAQNSVVSIGEILRPRNGADVDGDMPLVLLASRVQFLE